MDGRVGGLTIEAHQSDHGVNGPIGANANNLRATIAHLIGDIARETVAEMTNVPCHVTSRSGHVFVGSIMPRWNGPIAISYLVVQEVRMGGWMDNRVGGWMDGRLDLWNLSHSNKIYLETSRLIEFENMSPFPGCECGCTINSPSGKLVLGAEAPCFDKHGRRAGWTIRVEGGKVVSLTIEYFRLTDVSAGQIWIRVHDGPSNSHNLLTLLNLNDISFHAPPEVHRPIIGTTNSMRIDLAEYPNFSSRKNFNNAPDDDDDVDNGDHDDDPGFIFVASFENHHHIASNDSDIAGITEPHQEGHQTILENVVTMIGISLCVGAVVASLLFVFKHRLERKRLKAELAKNTPAKQALLAQQKKTAHSSCSSFSQGSPLANRDKSTPSRSDEFKTKTKVRSVSTNTMVNENKKSVDLKNSQGNSKTPLPTRKSSYQMSSKISQTGSPHSTKDGVHGNQPWQSSGSKVDRLRSAQSIREKDKIFKDEKGKKEHKRRRKICPDKIDKNYHGLVDKPENSNGTMVDSFFCGGRPPVEGRDSLTGDQIDNKLIDADDFSLKNLQFSEVSERSTKSNPRGPAVYVAPMKTRYAEKKSLKTSNNDTKNQYSSIYENEHVRFSDQDTSPECSDFPDDGLDDDFEYDDYIEQLPGSYFNMDPKAYTLTWSRKNEPWYGTEVCGRSTSDVGEGYIEDSI